MSNVQNNYKTEPSQNTALGAFSLAEGATSYDDIDDIIRQLMADIREDSDDLRTQITALNARLTATIASAESAATDAQQALDRNGVLSEQMASVQETAECAEDAATAAQTAATSAETTVSGITGRLAAIETLAACNQESVTSLDERIGNIEASGAGADYVQTDGVSIGQSGGVLSVLDVPVAGNTTDLASGRGQIGRTAIPVELADLDTLIADGWYAISGETLNLPEGVTEGVCRASSGFTSGTVVQTMFTYDGTPPRLCALYDGCRAELDIVG